MTSNDQWKLCTTIITSFWPEQNAWSVESDQYFINKYYNVVSTKIKLRKLQEFSQKNRRYYRTLCVEREGTNIVIIDDWKDTQSTIDEEDHFAMSIIIGHHLKTSYHSPVMDYHNHVPRTVPQNPRVVTWFIFSPLRIDEKVGEEGTDSYASDHDSGDDERHDLRTLRWSEREFELNLIRTLRCNNSWHSS